MVGFFPLLMASDWSICALRQHNKNKTLEIAGPLQVGAEHNWHCKEKLKPKLDPTLLQKANFLKKSERKVR